MAYYIKLLTSLIDKMDYMYPNFDDRHVKICPNFSHIQFKKIKFQPGLIITWAPARAQNGPNPIKTNVCSCVRTYILQIPSYFIYVRVESRATASDEAFDVYIIER
jgi:hypothetical protein